MKFFLKLNKKKKNNVANAWSKLLLRNFLTMVVNLLQNSIKKKIEKKFVFFTKYTLFAENVFIWKKSVILKNLLLKKKFYREKHKWKCEKHISFEKYIFIQEMFVLQMKNKSFLNIYSLWKKISFDHKKYICCPEADIRLLQHPRWSALW